MGRRILGRASRSRFSVPLTRSHGTRKGEVPRTQFRRIFIVTGITPRIAKRPQGRTRKRLLFRVPVTLLFPFCSVLGDTVGTSPKGDARRKPLVNTATERTTLGLSARALAFSCGCNRISRRTESKEVRGAWAVAQGTFCRKGHLPLGKVQIRPILSARRWRREPFDSKNLNGFSRESMSKAEAKASQRFVADS